jgi:hypothetical protein
MKFLSMQFSPTSCHFITIRSKYSPQHSVLKHLRSTFPSQCQRPSFIPIQNDRQNYSFVYLNLYVFDSRREDKRVWTELQQALPEFNLLLISSWTKFWFVTVVPKYIECVSCLTYFVKFSYKSAYGRRQRQYIDIIGMMFSFELSEY